MISRQTAEARSAQRDALLVERLEEKRRALRREVVTLMKGEIQVTSGIRCVPEKQIWNNTMEMTRRLLELYCQAS